MGEAPAPETTEPPTRMWFGFVGLMAAAMSKRHCPPQNPFAEGSAVGNVAPPSLERYTRPPENAAATTTVELGAAPLAARRRPKTAPGSATFENVGVARFAFVLRYTPLPPVVRTVMSHMPT